MTRRTKHERVLPEVAEDTGELVYANGIDATTGRASQMRLEQVA